MHQARDPAASNLSPFDGPRDRSIALPLPSVKARGGRQGALLSRGSWRPSRARRQHWETLMSNKCTPCRRDSGRGSECTRLRGGLEDRFALGPLAPMPDCGHVGCCDDSPNRHATKHFHKTRHPIIEGYDPPQGWGCVTSTRSCWISVIAPYHRDARMAHQFGRPRKQQIGLHPVRGVPVRAVRALVAAIAAPARWFCLGRRTDATR